MTRADLPRRRVARCAAHVERCCAHERLAVGRSRTDARTVPLELRGCQGHAIRVRAFHGRGVEGSWPWHGALDTCRPRFSPLSLAQCRCFSLGLSLRLSLWGPCFCFWFSTTAAACSCGCTRRDRWRRVTSVDKPSTRHGRGSRCREEEGRVARFAENTPAHGSDCGTATTCFENSDRRDGVERGDARRREAARAYSRGHTATVVKTDASRLSRAHAAKAEGLLPPLLGFTARRGRRGCARVSVGGL